MNKFNKNSLLSTVASGHTVAVAFTATWCGPCKSLKPKFEKLPEKYSNVIFGAFDIEEDMDFIGELKIQHVPAIIFYKNGEKVGEIFKNVTVEAIEQKIEELK